ncbi:ABC transporter substrate-binding protein [Atopobacter phocae]|uniref:ABC transporter substrate-binding protein n=1 Tax=Atopobacter phocae TaxID=136492 RepID=UPI000470319D|nr:ABC transporter substrate-binding protein [Atopobacter phocae]
MFSKHGYKRIESVCIYVVDMMNSVCLVDQFNKGERTNQTIDSDAYFLIGVFFYNRNERMNDMLKQYIQLMTKMFVIVGGLILIILAGHYVSNQKRSTETTGYRIGIAKFMDHASLNAAVEGFEQALSDNGLVDGDTIQIDYKSSEGDQANLQSIGQQFKGRQDLIFAIATPAAQAMAMNEKETPILFTAVTDPVSSQLIQDEKHPEANITGTKDAIPVERSVNTLLQVKPTLKTIGFIYNGGEQNSIQQLNELLSVAKQKGIQVKAMSVSSTNDVQQATINLARQVDGMYLPTDNTITSSIATIGPILTRYQLPTVGADYAMFDYVLATYGVDYYQLGYQTGEMAVQLYQGKATIQDLPVEAPATFDLHINQSIANQLNIPTEVTDQLK